MIFAYILSPVPLLLGIEPEYVLTVSKLIAKKIFLNDILAYEALGRAIKDNHLNKRSEIIATYALCGFGNFGDVGIVLGAMGILAPTKKDLLSRMALKSMIAGNISCFFSACIAGLLYNKKDE